MRLRLAWLATGLSMALSGCVVLAPEAEGGAASTVLLKIQESKVDPSQVSAVEVTSAAPVEFSVVGAVTAVNTAQPLFFYWFYDYDAALKLLTPFQVCTIARERCKLQPCKLANPVDRRHWLRVVVADQPILPEATTPFDFPPGTHFDSVLWQVSLNTNCSEP